MREELLADARGGDVDLDALLGDHFIRDLHRRLCADVWTWGGRLRIRELSIGVEPEQISVQLRAGLETIRYRWENTTDWTAHILGMVVHAETTRIHPFADGNGRSTRLLADLVHLVTQPSSAPPAIYDWDLPDRLAYIDALRRYERMRPWPRAAAIPSLCSSRRRSRPGCGSPSPSSDRPSTRAADPASDCCPCPQIPARPAVIGASVEPTPHRKEATMTPTAQDSLCDAGVVPEACTAADPPRGVDGASVEVQPVLAQHRDALVVAR
ncbi:hypothetical protein BN12_30063 [Nostocoides japonicum T1-X7]|uniref:Fido domain-containing protein n=1 Tax=Nostocoides japonicum T1-X7 TaxID=1194083 RepID=A0A077M087_9MICO|nr:Fic family protein [Tetrasphaera japonica]CCH78537.1 hypothetical protein BN12_30063 [Tetrasphaera japonica T1-X7]